MNVGELRKALAEIPDETLLLIDGCCDSGYDELRHLDQRLIALNANTDSHGGPHMGFDPDDSYDVQQYGHATRVQGIALR